MAVPADALSRFAFFVAQLERAAVSKCLESGFPEKALALLGACLRAGSGVWAQGSAARPAKVAWTVVDAWNLERRALPGILGEPARSSAGGSARLVSEDYFDEGSGIAGRLMLSRSAGLPGFGPSARRFLKAALPLLRQARVRWERERIMAEVRPHSFASGPCIGIADSGGRLLEASGDFAGALSLEFPSWRGPRLPPRLMAALVPFGGARREFLGSRIRVRCHALEDRCLLDVDTQLATQRLSEAERRVLGVFTRRPDVASVADELGISPNTVRVHIQGFYRKLGVRGRPELMKLIGSMPAEGLCEGVAAPDSVAH